MEYNSQLNGMVKDVEKVVNEHMKKILTEHDEKQKQMEYLFSLINELPFVKKLVEDNEKLQKRIEELERNSYDDTDEEEGIKLKIRDKTQDVKSIQLDSTEDYLSSTLR